MHGASPPPLVEFPPVPVPAYAYDLGADVDSRGAMGLKCAAHVHRSLVPLEVHHVWPLGNGGPDIPSNKVTVCSNGHSAIHDLLSKMLKGEAPWTVRAHYGWRIRRLAKRGYDQIREAT